MIGLSDIKTGLDILEKLVGWGRRALGMRKQAPESLPSRFFRLFESHGVHRNQIPRFFDHGLTLKDVQSENALLGKLDETVLQAACDLFAVRREWLDGAEPEVYSCHDFYKHPAEVAGFLETLKVATPNGDLDGILLAPDKQDGEALIILSETIGAIGEKPIYRYHLLNNWLFSYWKSRAYLAACVAIAWKHRVYIEGTYVDSKVIDELAQGSQLLGESDGTLRYRRGRKWYPEDMSLKPEVFLKGVDPGLKYFGLSSAIDLWLHLHEQGFMDSGPEKYDQEEIRKQFLAARSGYVPRTA